MYPSTTWGAETAEAAQTAQINQINETDSTSQTGQTCQITRISQISQIDLTDLSPKPGLLEVPIVPSLSWQEGKAGPHGLTGSNGAHCNPPRV